MPEGAFTRLLRDLRGGNEDAFDELYALVYEELHRLAQHRLARQSADETLRTTELVHEAYLKLARGAAVEVRDRGHFFGLAARVMRQILVDRARSRRTTKRGAQPIRLDVDLGGLALEARAAELVALDDALTALEQLSPRQTRVVELRFFVGLTVEETAEVLDIAPRTVKRDWERARLFLIRELGAASHH